jgi:GAF domain-containing protein
MTAPTSSPPLMSTDARLAAVQRYEILDTPRDGAFDQIAVLAATIFGTPIGSVTIVDTDRVWFKALNGLEGVTEIGIEPGLCASVIERDGPYVVTDAGTDPRTRDHPLVRGELAVRFYAAAPIVTPDGHRLGTVNVIDQQPREPTDAQTDMLTRLAVIVADLLELRLSAARAIQGERLLREVAERDRLQAERLLATVHQAGALAPPDGEHIGCELGRLMEAECVRPADVKVADSWGDSAWSCTEHASEALVLTPGVFLATEDSQGLAVYRRRG